MSDVTPKEIRERFVYHNDAWDEWRTQAEIDREYVDGNPWPKDEQAAREGVRPCYVFNELKQYTNALVNGFRQNKRGIKVGPDEFGTDEKTAELEENHIRQIEYKSQAQVAYTTAGTNQVKGGYGFVEVKRVFIPGTFEQEIRIVPIENVDSVSTDPDSVEPDNSDMMDAFQLASASHEDFKHDYPDAEIRNFSNDLLHEFPQWVNDKRVQLARYWRAKKSNDTIVQLAQDGSPLTLEEGMRVIRKPNFNQRKTGIVNIGGIDYEIVDLRKEDKRTITKYITNGIEILDEIPWDGSYIPIIPFWGERIYLRRKLVLKGLGRDARDPAMALNTSATTVVELTGQMPKAPLMAAEGQFEGHEAEVANANRVPLGFIYYKPVVDSGLGPIQVAAPQRAQFEPAVQSLMSQMEIFRRAIQSSTGLSPLPTSAQRVNNKSGIALQEIQEATNLGSYAFTDNYERGITNVGKVVEDLLGPTIDTKRKIINRKPDDTHELVEVDENAFKLRHDVTISTGPSSLNQAEKVKEFALQTISNNSIVPAAISGNKLAQQFLGASLKLLQLGPMGDPLIDALDPEQQGQQVPPELQQQMMQQTQALQALNAHAQQMEQENAELKQKLEFNQEELAQKERIAAADRESKERIAAMQYGAKLEADLAKLGSAESLALGEHEARFLESEVDREHEIGMTMMGHAQKTEMADQQHEKDLQKQMVSADQSSQLAEQQHEQGLEQQQQAAELAPEPVKDEA
jgi:hypothetical protein